MEKDLNVQEAQGLILENLITLPSEEISLMQAAGRVLAEELKADENLPSSPQSAVDGFALGIDRAPINSCFFLANDNLPVDNANTVLSNEQAVKVLTGGILPAGTRSVIMHEKVILEDNRISIMEEIKPGNNIKQAGEDYRRGEILASSKTLLSAGHIGLLAALGHSQILVYQRPRVALLGLSSNVVNHGQTPGLGQIRDSNIPMLAALISQAGGSVTSHTLSAELEEQHLNNYLDKVKLTADLLIIIGGTYAETESEAQSLLESAGARMHYWGTDVQPGSHNGFAHYQSIPVFALSGNPAACVVGFSLFVIPALRYLQGLSPLLNRLRARCINRYSKAARSQRFVRGRVQYSPEGWQVTILPGQKPSMLRSLVDCNALVDLPAGHGPLEPGQEVSVLLLELDHSYLTPELYKE